MSHIKVQDNSKGEKIEKETCKDSQVLSFEAAITNIVYVFYCEYR